MIDDAYLDNELGLFPDEEELQGIRRLNVFKYFEDINMLLPIETVIDEETNTISAMVDELGTYCVVDMEKWLSNLLGADMPEAVNLMTSFILRWKKPSITPKKKHAFPVARMWRKLSKQTMK